MKLTKPSTKYNDTTIRHHHKRSDRYNPGRCIATHEKICEVVSQPVSLGSDIALYFNGPSCDCLLVNVTALLFWQRQYQSSDRPNC